MKWGVWAIPPSTEIFSDLKPRFQMWGFNGQVCEYSSQEEAQAWADECNSCTITKWKYEVRKIEMTPAELDKQSPVKINRWIDIDSEESKSLDQDRALTKKMVRIGFEDKWMITDSLGRLWGLNREKNIFFPFHFEHVSMGQKLLIGYRISTAAAN